MRVSSFGSFLLVLGGSCLATGTLLGCGGTTTSPAETTGKDSGSPSIVLPIDFDATARSDAGPDGSLSHDAGHDTAPPGVDAPPPPTDAELNTYPSFVPDVPQVQSNGGQVLANPVFVPIIFPNDTYAAQIPPFMNAIGQSQYWKTAVSEYGVGAGTAVAPIILDETMPTTIDDSQLQVWLTNRIGLDPRFGALPGSDIADAGPFDAGVIDANAPVSSAISPTANAPVNAIYTLFLPEGTTVTLQGSASCSSFGGYHNSFYYGPNGSNVTYAVVPRCSGLNEFQGFDQITAPTSHELVEASTDPQVGSQDGEHDAYDSVDQNHIYWEFVLGGGEIGDMCAQFPGAFYHPSEASMSNYMVQRIWSNASARAGHDPCVPTLPAADEPYYFNSVPESTSVMADYQGFNLRTLGITAPVGSATTIVLDLFSDAPTNGQQWQITAMDANSVIMGTSPDLIFSPATVYGANGFKVELTVTNLGNDGSMTHPFIVESSLGDLQNWWIGVVTD